MGQEDAPTRSQGQGHRISSPTEETMQEASPPAANCARSDVEQTEEGEDSQSQQEKAQDLSLARVRADIPSFQVCLTLPSWPLPSLTEGVRKHAITDRSR